MDIYYVKSGLEFVAYENYKTADDTMTEANNALEEIAEEKPDLQSEYEEAKYELDRANNRQEYEERRAIFDDVNDRLNNLLNKERTAQETYDFLKVEIVTFKQNYENAE